MGNRASPLIPCPTTWSSPERQLLTGKPDTGQTTGFPVSLWTPQETASTRETQWDALLRLSS